MVTFRKLFGQMSGQIFWMLSFTLFFLVFAIEARAQYPTKPITLVVPFGTAGDSDVSARLWAKFAERELGQPVRVVNKTGAGGLTGTIFAATAKPDGYTIFLGQAGPCVVMPLLYTGDELHADSFAYVTRFMRANTAVVVAPSAPWQSLKEFQADAIKQARKYIFSSPSTVAWLTLAFSSWASQNDVYMRHVNYASAAEAATSVIGMHGDITFLFPNNYTSLVDEGRLKILAMADKSTRYPQAQTFAEQGYRGDFYGWSGIVVPKETPQEIIDKLIEVTQAVIENPKFVEEVKALGFTLDKTSGAAWEKEVREQYKAMEALLMELGYVQK